MNYAFELKFYSHQIKTRKKMIREWKFLILYIDLGMKIKQALHSSL